MFEGKKIKLITPNGEKFNAIVVSCVKDVGISIVAEDNPKRYLYCLRMKLAPNFNHKRGQITKMRKIFTNIRKEIISGLVDRRNGSSNSGRGASAQTCPFGQ